MTLLLSRVVTYCTYMQYIYIYIYIYTLATLSS